LDGPVAEDGLPLHALLPSLDGAAWLEAPPPTLQGRACLVHFFSLDAPWCFDEFPSLRKLIHGWDAVVGIGIHVPLHVAKLDAVCAVVQEHGLSHAVALDDARILSRRFNNTRVPTYYLFDAAHRLRYHQLGPGTDMLRRAVQEVAILAQ
jgi:hypothetical protein